MRNVPEWENNGIGVVPYPKVAPFSGPTAPPEKTYEGDYYQFEPGKSEINFSANMTRSPRVMFLVNLETLEKIAIQFVPTEMRWETDSSWVVIPTVGRNNPFYHYTGSEQTLTFQLDWNAQVENRTDVIKACRWVEDLSRADGYDSPPPRVRVIFGNLFEDYVFIVEKAPFKMSLFHAAYGMMPTQAYQEITLKRITAINVRKVLYPIEPRNTPQPIRTF